MTGGYVANNVGVTNGKVTAFVNSSNQLVITYTAFTMATGCVQTFQGSTVVTNYFTNTTTSGNIMSSAMSVAGYSARAIVADASTNTGMWSITVLCQAVSPTPLWAISIL
jgi:hypothetical protein